MLSAILQKATGTDLMDYLRPHLFEPLGIRNPSWEKSRDGITLGGYGLKLVWEHILGPMEGATLPADSAGRAALGRKLAGLTLAPQPGRPSSARAASGDAPTRRPSLVGQAQGY